MEEKARKKKAALLCWDDLGPDPQLLVLSYLDGASLGRCLLVSRGFRQLAGHPHLWRKLCEEELGLPTQVLSSHALLRWRNQQNTEEEEGNEEEENEHRFQQPEENAVADFYVRYKRYHMFAATLSQRLSAFTPPEKAIPCSALGMSSAGIGPFYSNVAQRQTSLLASYHASSSPCSSSQQKETSNTSNKKKEEKKNKKTNKKLMKEIHSFSKQVSIMQTKEQDRPAHRNHAVRLVASHDLLFSASWDGRVMAWRCSDLAHLRTYYHGEEEVRHIHLFKSWLFVGGQDGRVLCWDVSDLRSDGGDVDGSTPSGAKEEKEEENESTAILSIHAHDRVAFGVQASKSGRFLFTCGRTKDQQGAYVKVWRLSKAKDDQTEEKEKQGKKKQKKTKKRKLSAKLVQTLEPTQPGQIMHMTMDKTGSYLFACGYGKGVQVWTVDETSDKDVLQFKMNLESTENFLMYLAVSNDNRLLYGCEGSGFLLVWDLSKFQLVSTTKVTRYGEQLECICPVGDLLFIGTSAYSFSIWFAIFSSWFSFLHRSLLFSHFAL
ncbi:F-box only protein 3, variant 3 [Balamuthia mandrillaris]